MSKTIKVILVVILVFINMTLSSQTISDTIKAHQYFIKGDSLLKQRAYKQSINSFEIAASIFKEHISWKRHTQSLNKIADNYYRLRDFDQVINLSNQAINICNEQLEKESLEEAKALITIGKVLRRKNKYYEALDTYKKALFIIKKQVDTSDQKLASLYNNIGVSYDQLGLVDDAQHYYSLSLDINQYLYDQKKENDLSTVYLNQAVLYSRNGLYKQATPLYKKTIKLDKEKYGEKHPYVAGDYNNIASNYSYIGEDYLALQYFQKQLNILKEILQEGDESFASAYRGIATQYTRLNKLDLALEYYNKALIIYRDIYGEINLSTANILLNIGGTYRMQNELNVSLKYLNKAIDIYKDILGEGHPDMLLPNDELGLFYEKKGEYDLASKFYQKNINIAVKNFGIKNQKTAKCYISKARIQLLNKEYSIAIQEFHNAIISASKEFKDTSTKSSPSINDYFDSSTLLSAIYGKAKALKLRKDENENDLILSYGSLFFCDSLIDHTRNTYTSTEDKMSLEKTTAEVYKDAVAAALVLYNKTKDKQYLQNAFSFSEKNKARLLDEQLRKLDAKNFAGISEDKLNAIQDVTIKLALYVAKLQEYKAKKTTKENTFKISTYNDFVFSYTRKKDSLLQVIEQEYPKYHQLRYDNSIISITDIQQKISEDTLLLEYFVTNTGIYAFVISKDDFFVEELKVSELDKNILQFRKAILDKDIGTYSKIGYQLFNSLIAPLSIEKSSTKNLIIIPDGMLWHLNFDLLLTKDSPETSAINLPYLLKKQVISYANSADLFFRENNNDEDSINECLAFSFSNTKNSEFVDGEISLSNLRNTKNDLPGGRKEIRAISDIIDGTYFYGKNAIESNFKKNAGRYGVVHLAVHGELDDKEPGNSKLFFTQVKDSIQDNYLYNQEIYNMEIPAELVVLSACKTGAGKIYKGEGIMSLGRAFQYAGAKSLVLTNWEISDETTPILMKNFYTNLKKGMDKAKALNQAKLQFLENTNVYRTDPFYWGGFYLMGNTNAINLKNNNQNNTFLLTSILPIISVFFGFFLYFRKKNRKA
ncbi:CHAT domain-containing tetratricopeptide repeat protein [Aquimarina sp. RZ0]|uniref:CHAT domain-containing protein n=1 Tax=Aquimarina sp. RZ0 TaxID=2607730 RepID=UPI0011F322E3|nr:CHAT domain-containing tetratricopeptide repeat protein [Aquimarina sp. RZ0]KAA1242143.1 CHAT domain-containing protein [Aquimarina sp. RZ0]